MDIRRRLHFYLAYFSNPPWETGVSPPELLDFIQSHPAGRALDLGCGTGTNCITLAKHGWRTIGVDFVGRAIRQARRKSQRAGVQVDFQHDDVTRLRKVTGVFDLILDMGCFHSLSDPGKLTYISNLKHLLAPGGTFQIYAILRDPGSSLPGITPADLEILTRQLRLLRRQGGLERGIRHSAWFWFTK